VCLPRGLILLVNINLVGESCGERRASVR
jgi:hypothetical protein